MLTPITPPGAEHALGRYTPAIEVDPADVRLVFVTGQVAVDEDGRTVGVGDVAAQAEQVYRNLRTVLAAAGGDLADLVQVTVYLTDRDLFDAFNRVRNRVFGDVVPPSSAVVVVAGLVVPDHLVEISAVAAIPSGRSRA